MKNQDIKQQELTEILPEDGQTEGLEQLSPPEVVREEQSQDGLLQSSPMMNEIYSRDEFRNNFNSFMEFLENPDAATDTFGHLVGKGRQLSADKIYDIAGRYDWLKWIIDRKTQAVSDLLLVTVFLTYEGNLILQNWTGISYIERAKIWLKNKAKAKKEAIKNGQRRSLFGWVFSERLVPEKASKPEN